MNKEDKKNIYNAPVGAGGAFFAMIFCYLFVSLAGQEILKACNAGEVVSYAIRSTFSIISMAVVQAFFVVKRKEKVFCVVKFKKFNPVYIVCAVLVGAGMMAGLGFVNEGVASILKKAGLNAAGINLPVDSPFRFALFSVLVAVLPAVIEEAFFRGLLLGSLADESEKAFSKRNVCAALSSAACFALYHCSLTQLVYQFIYGLFLAFLTIEARSAIPAALAHFINNFAVLAFFFADVKINLFNPVVIVSGIAGLAAFCGLTAFIGKKAEKSAGFRTDSVKVSGEKDAEFSFMKFWFPFGLAGAAVCAVLAIGSAVAV